MEPKKILKIRLMPDGTWQNIYATDDAFQQLDDFLLAELYRQQRQLAVNEYAGLVDQQMDYIEQALEFSDYEESKNVLSNIMSKK
mgnify:CR=1 FL=1|jgi:hypothetical protein